MHLLKPLAGRLARADGFTMPAVMGAMVVITALTLVALGTASGDMNGSRRDQDYKRAYAAAEAGVNEYLFRLNADQAYWTKCTTVPAPAKINQPWNGSGGDPREKRTLVGSDAQYSIELLPRSPFKLCDSKEPTSMIDPSDGTFRVRATGFVRGVKRSVIATYRRVGFLDFLYYTDLETANPVSYKIVAGGYNSTTSVGDLQKWASINCSKPFEQRRNAMTSFRAEMSAKSRPTLYTDCTEINFIGGDDVRGPLHTNDQMLICRNPAFGRKDRSPKDPIEVVSPAGWRANNDKGCATVSPTFNGERRFGARRLDAPPVVSLKAVADDAYRFTGKTKIVLNGNSLSINDAPYSWPAKGVIYVQNGDDDCTFYDPTDTEEDDPACGDVTVTGTYSKDLTIAVEKDIRIIGDVTMVDQSNSMLGLIAQNFIRVSHPVTSQKSKLEGDQGSYYFSWSCSNGTSIVHNIDAAMLAIDHSFTVDNYYCGAPLGDLNVTGAIAQRYRGTVGTGGGSIATGYRKVYEYDDRLRYRQPPYFLDPIQTGWRVIRQTEQAPAR